MRRIIAIALILAVLPVLAGAASDTMEPVFAIDLTLYENHTVKSLNMTAVDKTEPLPYSEGPYTKPYEFAFYDAEGSQLSSQTVHIQFPSAPLLPEGASNMASISLRLPASQTATELRITQDGEQVTSVDLVDRVCSPKPNDVCTEYCGFHDADPDCQTDNALLLIMGVVLLIVGILAGALYWTQYR